MCNVLFLINVVILVCVCVCVCVCEGGWVRGWVGVRVCGRPVVDVLMVLMCMLSTVTKSTWTKPAHETCQQ